MRLKDPPPITDERKFEQRKKCGPEEMKFTNDYSQAYSPRFYMIRKEQTTDVEARSIPLRNTYNSTFIVLVISIAAILAVILVFWPAGGF